MPKAKIDADITALQSDVKSAAAKLSAMKQAGAVHWKEFEADVSPATARLHKSKEEATGGNPFRLRVHVLHTIEEHLT